MFTWARALKSSRLLIMSIVFMLLLIGTLPGANAHAAESDSPSEIQSGVTHVPGIPHPQQNNPEFVTYIDRNELPDSAKDFTRIRVMTSSAPIDMSGVGIHKYTNYSDAYGSYYGSTVPFEGDVYILTILFDDDINPLAYNLSTLNLTLDGSGEDGEGSPPNGSAFGKLDRIEANERDIVLTTGQTRKVRIYAIDTNGIEKEITKDKKTIYRSDSASIADVSAGVIKAGKREGTATITVSYGGKKVHIPVSVAKTSIVQLKPSMKTVTIEAGELEQLSLSAVLSDGSVRDVTSLAVWLTDNSSVAYVEGGEIEAIEPGSAVITAFYNGLSIDINVEIDSSYEEESLYEVVGLETSNKNIKMKIGEEKLLQIYAVFDDGSKEEVTDSVLWQTSKSDVVEVEEGILIAGKSGKASITATYENKSIQLTVQVEKQKAIKSLIVSTKNVTIKRGNEKELVLTAVYTDGTKEDITVEAAWSTRNDTIADVDAGVVVANRKGSTVITAKYNDKFVNILVKVN